MSSLATCTDCNHPVSRTARHCPNCGKLHPSKLAQRSAWAVGLLILSPVLFALLLVGYCSVM